MVDNGTGAAELERAAGAPRRRRAAAAGARTRATRAPSTWRRARAQGEALVLLNDDSVVDPGYVEAHRPRALDPGPGVVMAAGVMRDAATPGADRHRRHRARPHPARLRLPERRARRRCWTARSPTRSAPRGRRPRSCATRSSRRAASTSACSPTGRTSTWSCACAAPGGRCRLATDARGTHEHSATLGPGSARKDYLIGYGRGYMLRKWGVLTPRRLPGVLARELVAGRRTGARRPQPRRGPRDGCAACARRAATRALPVRPSFRPIPPALGLDAAAGAGAVAAGCGAGPTERALAASFSAIPA